MPNDMTGAMGDEDTMPHGSEPAQDKPQQDDDDTVSVFLPKAALPQGRKYAKGDTIELTVEDVDAETGDIQACVYGEEANKTSGGSMGYQQAFDKAMPEES